MLYMGWQAVASTKGVSCFGVRAAEHHRARFHGDANRSINDVEVSGDSHAPSDSSKVNHHGLIWVFKICGC